MEANLENQQGAIGTVGRSTITSIILVDLYGYSLAEAADIWRFRGTSEVALVSRTELS